MVGVDSSQVNGAARQWEWREQQGKALWVPVEKTDGKGGPAGGRAARMKVYTMEQIAEHNKPDDLWIVIDGKVYDVSKWAIYHPGGHLCMENVAGADATDAFENYHPAYVYETKLPRFQVGVVGNYKDSEFVEEFRSLRQRLLAEGMYETRMSYYVAHTAWMASLLALSIYLTAFCESTLAHLLGAIAMGWFHQQLAFTGHDLGHNGVTHIKSIDHVLGLLVGNALGGISMGWWKWSHNVHHVVTNSVEHDPDIQHLPVFAVSPKIFKGFHSTFHDKDMVLDAAARWFVSMQHWLYYPIMGVARFNLYAQSLILIFSKEQWPYKFLELPFLVIFWIWFGYLLSFLPSYGEIAMWLLVSHALSGILHVQITLSHFSMDTYYGRPRFNTTEDNWFKMQLATSMDVACGFFGEWFHGGLQYQVEHHLFPRLPRHNLKYASRLVKEFAEKHGVEYRSPSFLEANVEVVGHLRKAAEAVKHAKSGKEALANSMLWEGMNMRG